MFVLHTLYVTTMDEYMKDNGIKIGDVVEVINATYEQSMDEQDFNDQCKIVKGKLINVTKSSAVILNNDKEYETVYYFGPGSSGSTYIILCE